MSKSIKKIKKNNKTHDISNQRIKRTAVKTKNKNYYAEPDSSDEILMEAFGNKVENYNHTDKERNEMKNILTLINKNYLDDTYIENQQIWEIVECVKNKQNCKVCCEMQMQNDIDFMIKIEESLNSYNKKYYLLFYQQY